MLYCEHRRRNRLIFVAAILVIFRLRYLDSIALATSNGLFFDNRQRQRRIFCTRRRFGEWRGLAGMETEQQGNANATVVELVELRFVANLLISHLLTKFLSFSAEILTKSAYTKSAYMFTKKTLGQYIPSRKSLSKRTQDGYMM